MCSNQHKPHALDRACKPSQMYAWIFFILGEDLSCLNASDNLTNFDRGGYISLIIRKMDPWWLCLIWNPWCHVLLNPFEIFRTVGAYYYGKYIPFSFLKIWFLLNIYVFSYVPLARPQQGTLNAIRLRDFHESLVCRSLFLKRINAKARLLVPCM